MGSIQLSHLKGFKAVRPDAHQFTKTTTVHQISAWYNSSKLSRNIWTIQEKVWIMLIPLFELKCHMIYRYIYNSLIFIWICQIQISWIIMIKVGLSIFFHNNTTSLYFRRTSLQPNLPAVAQQHQAFTVGVQKHLAVDMYRKQKKLPPNCLVYGRYNYNTNS